MMTMSKSRSKVHADYQSLIAKSPGSILTARIEGQVIKSDSLVSTGNAPRILDAFSRWLYLAHCGGLPEAELARHPLTDAAIEGLGKQETFDDAVEAVVSLINATSDGGQPGKSSLDLISKIVPAVSPSPCPTPYIVISYQTASHISTLTTNKLNSSPVNLRQCDHDLASSG